MTIKRLYKTLGKLIKQGHGRKRVCVNKGSFHHNCEEDGVVILDIEKAEIESFRISDGDGGTKCDSRGYECLHTALVIKGE